MIFHFLIIDLYIGPDNAGYVLASDLEVTIDGLDTYKLSQSGSQTYKNVYGTFKLTTESKEESKEEQKTEETKAEEPSISPKTGDNLISYLIILTMGIIGLVTTRVLKIKNQL